MPIEHIYNSGISVIYRPKVVHPDSCWTFRIGRKAVIVDERVETVEDLRKLQEAGDEVHCVYVWFEGEEREVYAYASNLKEIE